MYTVADLIGDPKLETISLTPGVGELRTLTWAHVCELDDPWNWLGNGALVMTTGIGIPEAEADQVAYVEQANAAGIAAVAIGVGMSAPPLTDAMLERAKELDFAVLETSRRKPFIVLAQAVNQANVLRQEQRLTTAEKIYEALTRHLSTEDMVPLLDELGALLGGTIRVTTQGDVARTQGDEWRIILSLPVAGDFMLEFTSRTEVMPDRSLLQYASAAVTALLAIRSASRRREVAQGALLLNRLIDGVIDADTAFELLEERGVKAPYRVTTWLSATAASDSEKLANVFAEHEVAQLSTAREDFVVFLTNGKLDTLGHIETHSPAKKLGMSASFSNLKNTMVAYRQAQSALSFPSNDRVAHYEVLRGSSPFLGASAGQAESAAFDILNPILHHDTERGTELLLTLRVFLEENRNWKGTAARLHVHRQTLYARVARIEQLTGRDLGSIAALSDFWLALQTVSSLGLLDGQQISGRHLSTD